MPTPTDNVLFLFVLPPAALEAADRLITALMTLFEAVTEIAVAATRTPTAHGQAAITIFFRLRSFLTTLIRISALGIRRPREPKPTAPAFAAPATRPDRDPSQCLPRRPGWILDVLPETAPAVAADLGLILADPAFAALLDAAPMLHRMLGPLLRALGLTKPPRPPPRTLPPPPAQPTLPASPRRPTQSQTQPPQPSQRNRPSEKQKSTPYSLRYRNK